MNTAYAEDKADVDKRTTRWLRKRHKNWSDAKISRVILRSRVIDDHPMWSDTEIDAEVAQREADREALS